MMRRASTAYLYGRDKLLRPCCPHGIEHNLCKWLGRRHGDDIVVARDLIEGSVVRVDFEAAYGAASFLLAHR